MATITSTVALTTRYSVQNDITYLEQAFAQARNTTTHSRVVIFSGEKHTEPCDLGRNRKLIANNGAGTVVTMGIERGMGGDLQPNQVREPFYEHLGPSDPQRNDLIAAQLRSHTKSLPGTESRRPIVLFYGQEHEADLKRAMQQTFPSDETIAWWSFPSIDDQVRAIGPVRAVNTPPFTLVGYAAPLVLSENDQRLALLALERGNLPFATDVDLYSDTAYSRYFGNSPRVSVHSSDANVVAAVAPQLTANGWASLTVNNANTVRVQGLTS